jgi:ribA/ribD-fused uncharacterized protein
MDRTALIAAFERGERPRFLFFWGHTPKGRTVGPWVLSNWFPSPFVIDGVTYETNEHWMMAEKARLFGDTVARGRVMKAPSPGEAKAIGREVRQFDDDVWDAARFGIVARGCEAKFAADAALRDYLLQTGDAVLVEASPRDRVWGIGLGASSADANDPRTWRGENLLGFALMEARARLRGVSR